MSAKPLPAEPVAQDAPVDAAFENAPVIELDNPDEVARLLREARAEVEAGAELIPHAEVMRRTRERFGTGPISTSTSFGTGPVGTSMSFGTGPISTSTSFDTGPITVNNAGGSTMSISTGTGMTPVISSCLGPSCL